jgi:hypothetical protein
MARMGGLRHLLAPGTPTYAVLKLSALAGVAGLSFAVRRRARHAPPHSAEDARATSPEPESSRRSPHPRSRKKRRRRRP